MNMRVASPEFAMSFTPEAVLLEQRQGLGWRPLGQAQFAGGGMKATLRALRDGAGLDDEENEILLVIPDEQILYTSLTVPVGADTPTAIGRTLEAMTPYRAEDLVFDWCPASNGHIETLRVAAVARRTLEEAEEFARMQGFRPSGFIARPGDDRFDGQPDFGSGLLPDMDAERLPFSEPDLSLARITAPEIPEAPTTPARSDPAAMATAPIVSRIPPHISPQASPAARPKTRIVVADPEPAEAAFPTDDAEMPVIRHGDPRRSEESGRLQHLSPRAQAFHARAQEARSHRHEDVPAEPEQRGAIAARLRGYKPDRLTKLVGGLLLGVVLILALYGGKSPEPVATAPAQSARTETPVPTPTPAPVPGATGETADPQPEQEAPVTTALPSAAPVGTVAPEAEPSPAAPLQDDSLARALAEAMSEPTVPEPSRPISAATMPTEDLATGATNSPPAATASVPTDATAPEQTTPPQRQTQNPLARSARPPRAAPEQAATPSGPDSRPTVPSNPLPFEQRSQAEPRPVTGIRPPARPSQPATPQAAPATESTAPREGANRTPRPPSRPQQMGFLEEGSRPEGDAPAKLTAAERAEIRQILRDLRTAQAGNGGLSQAERDAVIRLADARPQRKPLAVSGPSQQAVRDALAQAVESSDRPERRGGTPAASNNAATLASSSRPRSKPGGQSGTSASLSKSAVEDAIASAVASSSALPGAVALTALSSSSLPPRRAGAAIGNAVLAAAPTAPTPDELRAAAHAQNADREREAALAEQRRIDSELQAQAEARARAFAAQDAAAEARARAQAEARARAQAEAEARAAAASKRSYTPPEAENEPEVAPSSIPDGRIATTAAANATVKDGIQISRTQIIGTIGAGKASRALVRLSSGKVITLRLGDKINGGTISDIGDSQITFVKSGRSQKLSVLNGQ